MSNMENSRVEDVPHVIKDSDGTVVAIARNLDMAESLASASREGFCVIREADEDDIAAFGRRLVDA